MASITVRTGSASAMLASIGGDAPEMPVRFRRQWQRERATTREVGRSLRRLGIPNQDIARALPCLFRKTMQYKKFIRQRALATIPLSVGMSVPYLLITMYGTTQSDSPDFLNALRDNQVLLLAGDLMFVVLGLWVFFMPPRRTVVAGRLTVTESPSRHTTKGILFELVALTKKPWAALFGEEGIQISRRQNRIVGVYNILFFGGAGLLPAFQTDPQKFFYAGADAILLVLYFAAVIYLCTRLVELFSSRVMPPDVALVHNLLLAYTFVYSGTATEWRSINRRRLISINLREAANTLEGPMQRILLGNDGGMAGSIVQSNLNSIADGLRQKVGWLATPKADTREHLARAIGEALVVAATGEFDRLLGSGMATTSNVRSGWPEHIVAVGRWAIVALGPGLGVFLGWRKISDPALQTLAIQFAAVCFLSATFSATIQRGDDRLSSIVSVGAGLFGWGKSRG